MTPMQTVLDALERGGFDPRPRKGSKGGYHSRCPAHDDHDPSLDIDEGRDGVVLFCRSAGCKAKAICSTIGLSERDLFSAAITPTKRIVATFDYIDGKGQLAYQALRLEPGKNGRRKDFQVRRPDGKDGWEWNLEDVARIPYGLPAILAAPPDATIYLVEGEAKADLLRKHGLVATTTLGGAENGPHTSLEVLHGRRVCILPDNDIAGTKYATGHGDRLHGKARELRLLKLPDLPPKGDCIDWFKAGHTVEEFRDLAAKAPNYVPQGTLAPVVAARHRTAIVRNLGSVETKRVEWLWQNRLAIGKLNLVAGHPGTSKSLLTVDVAAKVTKGRPFADTQSVENSTGDVIVLTAEDDLGDTWKPRLLAADGDPNRVHVVEAVEHTEVDKQGRTETRRHGFSLDADLERLDEVVSGCRNPRLLIVDPIGCYLGADTNSHSDADVRAVLAPLAEWAARNGICVVMVMHLNKCGGQTAMHRVTGSLAFIAAARSGWLVCLDPNPDQAGNRRRRLFLPLKSNLSGDVGGLAYTIETTSDGIPYLVWSAEPVTMTADSALAPQTGEKMAARDKAKEWLVGELADGIEVHEEEIKARAAEAGIAERTLWRAKRELGVKPKQVGFGKGKRSYWYLPSGEPQRNPCQPTPTTECWQELDNGGSNWDSEREQAGIGKAACDSNSCHDCQHSGQGEVAAIGVLAPPGDEGRRETGLTNGDDSDIRERVAVIAVEAEAEREGQPRENDDRGYCRMRPELGINGQPRSSSLPESKVATRHCAEECAQ